MNEINDNEFANKGQASPKSNMWSVLSPLIFVIIVIAIMAMFAQ